MKTLASIIQSSVDKIEEVLAANALVLSSSNAPFSLESESPRMHPSIQSAGSLITSAAAQLMTLGGSAPLVVLDVMMQVNWVVPVTITLYSNNRGVIKFHGNACCSECSCCRDPSGCGPQGSARYPVGGKLSHLTLCLLRVYTYGKSLSLRKFILRSSVCINIEYNESTNTVSSARILRILATNYIFLEVSPDVFANNRLSTVWTRENLLKS
jgi:hypothetical protein